MKAISILILALVLLSGCAPGPIVNPSAKLPVEDSAAFLDRVSSQADVPQNDAFRGVLMLIDGRDDAGDFAQRTHAMEHGKRNIIPLDMTANASKAITKGELAYILYQVCHIRGGLTLALTGPSQRYCLRELQYQGFITRGSVADKVTGMEFVAIVTRAEYYRKTGHVPEVLMTSPTGE